MDTKEILEFLFGKDNVKDIDSIEKFKEKFNGDDASFVATSELSDPKSAAFKKFLPKAVGTISGRSTSLLKKRLGELDIDLTPEEIKGKELEEIIEIGLGKTVTTVKGKFKEYDDKLKQNTDDRVITLTSELEKTKQKYTDLDGLHKTLKTTYDTEKSNHDNELKSFKKKTIVDGYHSKDVKFAASAKDLEKDGFYARINSKYKVELNDKGDDVEIFDVKTNARIPGKQAGTFKGYKEVLEDEGIAAGIWATNEGARRMNQNNGNFANYQNQNQNQNDGGNNNQQNQNTQRKVSSRVADQLQ